MNIDVFSTICQWTWSDVQVFDKSIFMGFDYFIFYFIHPIFQTFTAYWWSTFFFSKKIVLRKVIKFWKLQLPCESKETVQRKMWRIIIHLDIYAYVCWGNIICLCFLKLPFYRIIICYKYNYHVLLKCFYFRPCAILKWSKRCITSANWINKVT